MSEKPEIQQIPVDPNGRYFIVVKGLPSEAFVPIAEQIKRWWASDEPVFLIALAPDVNIEFVRVDNEQAGQYGLMNAQTGEVKSE